VNRTEAEEIAARLTRRHPSRTAYQWFVREGPDGQWVVVKVGVPGDQRLNPVVWKDVGGPYAG